MKTRLLMFVLGIFLMGMGVAIITKVDLGTSPISTIPYVLSYIAPGSFGFWTIMLSVVFITLQMVLLRNFLERTLYLQLLISPILGFAIDIGMWLLQFYMPKMLVLRILFLIIGCFVLAIGIYLQIQAKLVMNPGESIVQVLSEKVNKPFSTVKIFFDWTLVISASILGLTFLKTPQGIGIGTLIFAFLVGYFVKLISNWKMTERISFSPFKNNI
jgi:uncharacterized protein